MRAQRIFGMVGVLVTSILVAYGVYQTWPGRQVPSASVTARPSFAEPSDPGHLRVRRELCPAIDRPEVLSVLEDPPHARGTGTSYGSEPDYLLCHVTLEHAVLRIETGPTLRIAGMLAISPDAVPLTVLGRPAYFEVSRSRLHVATLAVAWRREDTGGHATIEVITTDQPAAGQATLVRLAELALPHVPGWPA
ncbi:hypothetical protein AB0B66_30905 [Catellatospora sp. NPDC049111]|uniref:hypothetical protein n=1 Tax=Catellatospora sp. NPDC049111 TaxID=3155271 RepID=UPI0033D4A914